jgi:hypothetical protein
VERAVHPIQGVQIDDLACACLIEVRLPEFDAGEYPQLWELVSATLDAVEVALGVQRRRGQYPVLTDQRTQLVQHVLWLDGPAGDVEVFGEGECRQAYLHRSLAHRVHQARR